MFPVRCECNRIISNKIETYNLLSRHTYIDIYKSSHSKKPFDEWCMSYLKMNRREIDNLHDPSIDLIHPNFVFRVLNIPVYAYCCRTRFLTFIEIPTGKPYDESHEYVSVIGDTLDTPHICIAR